MFCTFGVFLDTTSCCCTIMYEVNNIIIITITTKCRIVNALVFPVVLYGCESWTIRKAERRRIDSFELWWRGGEGGEGRGGMTVIHIVIGMFTSNPMIPQYLNNNLTELDVQQSDVILRNYVTRRSITI